MSDGQTTSLVIDCQKVTRTYSEGPETLTIFSDISLQVKAGETVAIVGSSGGAGKTTLLNLLGGLDRPSSGHIRICGKDIHQLSEAGRARFRNQHLGGLCISSIICCRNLPHLRMSCCPARLVACHPGRPARRRSNCCNGWVWVSGSGTNPASCPVVSVSG